MELIRFTVAECNFTSIIDCYYAIEWYRGFWVIFICVVAFGGVLGDIFMGRPDLSGI